LLKTGNNEEKQLFLSRDRLKIAFLISGFRAFHGFGQAKFAYGGLVLGLSQFSQLPQLLLKTTLDLKVVKTDLKIINLLP
jgi:hypothetical protein